jgi:hypothetical protein
VKPLDSGDSRICDGLQVSVNAFAGYVSTDEVEPSFWIKDLGGLLESGFVSGAERRGKYTGIGNDAYRLGPQTNAG